MGLFAGTLIPYTQYVVYFINIAIHIPGCRDIFAPGKPLSPDDEKLCAHTARPATREPCPKVPCEPFAPTDRALALCCASRGAVNFMRTIPLAVPMLWNTWGFWALCLAWMKMVAIYTAAMPFIVLGAPTHRPTWPCTTRATGLLLTRGTCARVLVQSLCSVALWVLGCAEPHRR